MRFSFTKNYVLRHLPVHKNLEISAFISTIFVRNIIIKMFLREVSPIIDFSTHLHKLKVFL